MCACVWAPKIVPKLLLPISVKSVKAPENFKVSKLDLLLEDKEFMYASDEEYPNNMASNDPSIYLSGSN